MDESLKVGEDISIYNVNSKWQKNAVLLAGACIALLTPFTDTVYLPALKAIGVSLKASDANVAATISAYIGALGLSQLFWGPMADKYGRLKVLYLGLVLYEVFTIGCIFADTVETLIVLRTIEGFFIGSSMVTVQAIIADVFAEEERGQAMGAFLTPMLIGPVIAPVIGGALSEAFNWRATFVLLAVMCVPITILAWFALPETHHYYVLKRLRKHDINYVEITDDEKTGIELAEKGGNDTDTNTRVVVFAVISSDETDPANDDSREQDIEANSASARAAEESLAIDVAEQQPGTPVTTKQATGKFTIIEASSIVKPKYMMPWETLGFMFEPQLAPSYALICTTFAVMFTSLITLPLALAEEPYSMSDSVVGVCYLPIGVAMLLGALLGGVGSDMSAARFKTSVEGRLVYGLGPMLLVPIGSVGFGFALHYGTHLAYVLVAQAVLGFGQAFLMPSILGYLSAARPESSGAVGSVMLFLCFAGAAVCISISVELSEAIGVHYFFVILAGISGLSCLWSIIDTLRSVSR